MRSSLFAALGILGVCCAVVLFTRLASDPEKRIAEAPEAKEAFPLILYGVPNTDEDILRAKELGFTHIYRSGSGFAGDPTDPERMEDIQTYLDRATHHGMKVAFCLDGHRRIPRGQTGLEQMQSIVARFKHHPAIGFWYFYDEPNLPSPKTKKAMLAARLQESPDSSGETIVKELVRPPELLLPAYEMVKREAPDIPVIVMMAITEDGWWRDAWKQFHATYDIVSFDTYPVYALPFPKAPIGRVTSWMDRYTKGTDKPVMPCLQIFNWNTLGARVERAKAAGNMEYVNWRYPNLEELRYWNFSSLIQGAPGAIYYTYGGPDLKRRPPDEWLDNTLKAATHELRRFTGLTQSSSLHRLPHAQDSPILSATWKSADGLFLVIANGSDGEQRIVQREILSELNRGNAKAWEFTRTAGLDLIDGKIAGINLEPWEIQIWQIR